MNQQSGTQRKVWIGGGIVAVAAAVAIAFGMGGIPRGDDVNGTVVAAERYRAPQAATSDVQLGDMSVAQLLQNDAFLKVIKDPEVQRLVVEPGFLPASRLLLDHPEAARHALAGRVDAQADEAMRLIRMHAAGAQSLLANPDANKAMFSHPEAIQKFVSAEIQAEADRASRADRVADQRARDVVADKKMNRQSGADAAAELRKAGGLAPDLKARLQSGDTAADRKATLQNGSEATADMRKAGGDGGGAGQVYRQSSEAAADRQINRQSGGEAVANVRKAGEHPL